MTTNAVAFATCSLEAAIAAILLGHAAGQYFNAGLNPAGVKAFAMALITCAIAGGFAYGAARCWKAKPSDPVEPVKDRKNCRTDW